MVVHAQKGGGRLFRRPSCVFYFINVGLVNIRLSLEY